MKYRNFAILLASSMFMVGAGCSGDAGSESSTNTGDGVVSIPDAFGKSDNYIATNALEFILSGTTSAELPDGFDGLSQDEQQTTLDELILAQTTKITNAAKRHVQDLLRTSNEGVEDEEAKFFIYVKPSYSGGEALDPMVEGNTVTWVFQLEMVGSADLIGLLVEASGDETFQVDIDGEPVEFILEPSPSTDAFPDYKRLFEDDIYDIAIHFGGDYNEERYDIETAKWTVEFLLESGWAHDSVSSFEELKHDSGPFVMPIFVEGRQIEAHVYVYHSDMDDDAEAEQSLLRELVELSVKERDVVIYSGHAGSNAGMILDYHPRYELDDDEFKDLEMSNDYQIWVFDGCNSYRTYVDKLMLNPARTFDNTTAVTTVNTTPFSAGYEVINRFVHWFTFADEAGNHFPVSWNTMLQGINDDFPTVHYGVHGIDNDPKLNPHAAEGFQCRPCSDNTDCGAGGNYCMNYSNGNACGVGCTSDAACGAGFECITVFDDPDLFYVPKQCVATTLTCE